MRNLDQTRKRCAFFLECIGKILCFCTSVCFPQIPTAWRAIPYVEDKVLAVMILINSKYQMQPVKSIRPVIPATEYGAVYAGEIHFGPWA